MQRPTHILLLSLILAASQATATTAPNAPQLSAGQTKLVANHIAALPSKADRGLAEDWVPAKKAAEFLCRPLALDALKKTMAGADRVFLGDNDPTSLRLITADRLEGAGSVRAGSGWSNFQFVCIMNPITGHATRFDVTF